MGEWLQGLSCEKGPHAWVMSYIRVAESQRENSAGRFGVYFPHSGFDQCREKLLPEILIHAPKGDLCAGF
jgi:hypothetical protein